MEAILTSISFRYRAPVRYLAFAAVFLCIGAVAAFFFAVVEPWVFRAVILFLMTVAFLGGIGFLAVYILSLNNRIIFFQDTVMLPYRYKRQPVILDYSEISYTEERHTYGRLFNLEVADGRKYILDESWMHKSRYDEMAGMFKDKTDA